MALIAPNLISVTAITSTRIDLVWENRGLGGYHEIHIERSPVDPDAFVEVADIDGTAEKWIDALPPLTPEVKYHYRVRGKLYETYTEYSNIKDAATPATLAPPSLCVATAFSNFIEVTWKDNSTREDTFRIARNKDDAGWVENFATIPANMDYYKDEAVVAGSVYQYRVLARDEDGPEESAPSNVDSATALSAPAIPTLAAILNADTKDKSIRIRWSDVANETGYRIEKDTVEIAVVGVGITDFLVTGLTPSVEYDFRIRAYNGVGNSDYSATRSKTTLTAYVPTVFEKWIRDPNIEPVYLAEIYAKMDLENFTHESGKVWKKTIGASDRGIDILEVFEDGSAYDSTPTQISEVEALASSFWFNYANRTLYVRSSAGDGDPAAFLIEGAFWLYFSTHKDIEFTVASGRLHHYLPLLAKEDIPDITQEIKPYFEGSFSISSGSIAFMNTKIGGEHFFDEKFATYTWINAKVILKAGSNALPVFTYAQFKEIFTAYINEKSCSDGKITFQLRDVREDMKNKIVLNTFDVTNYPWVEDKFRDKPRPVYFGFQALTTPVCIDEVQEKFQCNDGRIKSVVAVYKNGSLLVKDKHYYVDYQRGRITFDRDGAFTITTDVNDRIDFDEGGGELWATLDPGTYTTAELLIEIKDELDDAGALTYTVTVDPNTKKFTIAATGDFSLLWKTGTHGQDGTGTHVGLTIGYAQDEDSEGESSYEADADVISIHKQDILGVRLIGMVNSADEVIENGAEIFKYLMNNYKSLTDTELNLDSIYEAKYASGAYEKSLSVPIEKEISFDEIIRSIEHSIESYTFQDELGRLGIKPQQTVVASKAKYIVSKHIFDHSQRKDKSSLFWKVNIYYNKDLDDNWEWKTAVSNVINWKYKVIEELPIYTYFSSSADADALATSILSLLNKEQIENTLSMLLFDVMAGDLIKFSRTRFYDSDGTASEIELRIIRISKSPASGKTSITAEVK